MTVCINQRIDSYRYICFFINRIKILPIFAELADFIGLTVYRFEESDNSAIVHFKADYLCDGYYCQLEETSQFILEDNQWRYLDGILTPHTEQKIGRNDKCPCGSEKKFKKCHAA